MKAFFVIFTLLATAGIVAIIWITMDAPPDQATLARIAFQRTQCVSLVADYRRAGVVRAIVPVTDGVTVEAVKHLWDSLTVETRLGAALAIYCAYTPPEGYFTVNVRSSEGEPLYKIVNGNVRPWW